MLLPTLNGDQLLSDLTDLAQIGASPSGGVNRLAYSPADLAGRAWVEAQMPTLGMEVRRDQAGNTIGIYAGSQPDLAPLVLASHTDSVPEGGRYDGSLGVLAGLACVRALHAAGQRTRHSIAVINFAAEEATVAGTLGSRAMVSALDRSVLQQKAWDGRLVSDHLVAAGLDPDALVSNSVPKPRFAAYLELHIEQGGLLEAAGIPIGIVEGIVGIRRYEASFLGYANHAGTTPMAGRKDALVAAAGFILAVRDLAVEYGIVGTVGTLQLQPGSSNVIPGRVDISVEIRSLHNAVLDSAEAELHQQANAAGGTLHAASRKEPVTSASQLVAAIERACTELDLPAQRMSSGAGHDAMCVAEICPEAMIFVPSRNGVSHSPDEYTSPEQCIAGATVLLATALLLDAELDRE